MELQRKQDLSLIYWLKDLLVSTPFINIVSEYTESNLIVPRIAVETGDTLGEPFELGNRNLLQERRYYIDIYASNISQRNDYAYKLFNELTSPIPVNDYDEGFPPDVTPTKLGNLLLKTIRIMPINVDADLVQEMHWRSVVYYTAVYSIV
jgi:hypothetical protein